MSEESVKVAVRVRPFVSFSRKYQKKHRSSRPEVFCKKYVLRNFTKFTGKYLCQSLFFKKVAGLGSANLLKKRPWHRCFDVNFVKFLRTPFLTEHLWWPLLEAVLENISGGTAEAALQKCS